MRKLTEVQELEVAIRLAASDAEASESSREVAQKFYADNRQLVASVADEWIVEKLATVIGKQRASLRRVEDAQYLLEFAIGLADLPRRVRLRSGRRVERSDMTKTQVRQWLADLRKKKSKTVAQAERMLELMDKYSKHGGERLTWGEVRNREAESAAKK